jgi:hypothetical protein
MPTITRCLIFAFLAVALMAQQGPPPNAPPDPPTNPGSGGGPANTTTNAPYTPPTHAERFQIYIYHTFGPDSIFEAAARAAIDQAERSPGQWPEGAKGYAERFGSAMGLQAVRGTAAYALGEAFREDLRYVHCAGCSASGKFTAAFENTFAARQGKDGHEVFSLTRLLAPIPGGIVASTWLPGKYDARRIGSAVAFTYVFDLAKNLVVELVRH